MHDFFRKGIGKYRSLSAPVKASLWFTICNIVQKGINLLSTPIFTRLLTTEQYGVYTVYQSWYQIITIFATLNLASGVFNNGLLKYEKEQQGFTSSIQGLSTMVTVGLFLVYLISPPFWNRIFDLPTLFIVLMFTELLFVPAYNFWSTKERFHYRYRALIVTTLIIAVGSPALGVITVLCTDHKAEARVFSYVFVQVCIGLAFYIYNIAKGKKVYDKEIWKFALNFNIPLIPHYLAFTVLNQSDRLMISNLCGKGEAAIYSVAYAISTVMTIFTSAINSSFIPYTYKAMKDKDYVTIRKTANALLLLVSFGCVVAMAFSPEIIKMFASKDYYEAIWIMPPLCASVFFMFLYPLFGNIEFYFEKTAYVTIASSIGAIANIILNYVFIKLYGYFAAGYTTLFCYILFSFMHYFFHRKIICQNNIYNIYDMRFMITLSIGMLCIMFIMTLTYRITVVRYIIILLLAFCAWRYKSRIIGLINKLKLK